MSKKGFIDHLRRSIPALLTVVANRLSITGSIAYFKSSGIGIMEFRAMTTLAYGQSLRAVQIAQAISLDKSAVSRTLKSLHQRGLVESTTRPGSRRPDYSLSSKGLSVYRSASVLAAKRQELLLQGISADDRARLEGMLCVMLENTGQLKALNQELKSNSAVGTKRATKKRRNNSTAARRSAV